MNMRLDRYISKCTALSRSLATLAIKARRVTVDGSVVNNPNAKVLLTQNIALDHTPLIYKENIYIMLNKPQGFICSTEDKKCRTVLELISPEFASREPFSCGRLDIDTTGLVLLTDDGQWSHRITSPKKACFKTYRIESLNPLSKEDMDKLASGVFLDRDDKITLPAKIKSCGESTYELSICEGRYHQVKRMFEAVGNKVCALHRMNIGDIFLDEKLALSEWRELTEEEVALFM